MKDLEYIIRDLSGASALVGALGEVNDLTEEDNAAAHYSIDVIIRKAIEDLQDIAAQQVKARN